MTIQFIPDELMVIEASRHISDGDVVLVGTGMPMIAALMAMKSHAPNMCYVVETGPIAPEVIPTPISVSDAKVMYRAARVGSLLESLGGVLQRGLVDVGFIGGAQVDQFANVNSTLIGSQTHPKVRFPGSGGANDVASHAKKLLIITRHEKRRFPAYCDYVTSPGYIDGPHGRKTASLPVPYPDVIVVTDMTVMSVEKTTGRLKVDKLMPGIGLDELLNKTAFEPIIPTSIATMNPPSEAELRILREEVDPCNLYVRGG